MQRQNYVAEAWFASLFPGWTPTWVSWEWRVLAQKFVLEMKQRDPVKISERALHLLGLWGINPQQDMLSFLLLSDTNNTWSREEDGALAQHSTSTCAVGLLWKQQYEGLLKLKISTLCPWESKRKHLCLWVLGSLVMSIKEQVKAIKVRRHYWFCRSRLTLARMEKNYQELSKSFDFMVKGKK